MYFSFYDYNFYDQYDYTNNTFKKLKTRALFLSIFLIINQVILLFWLVLAYDLLEGRRMTISTKFFSEF